MKTYKNVYHLFTAKDDGTLVKKCWIKADTEKEADERFWSSLTEQERLDSNGYVEVFQTMTYEDWIKSMADHCVTVYIDRHDTPSSTT